MIAEGKVTESTHGGSHLSKFSESKAENLTIF